MNNGSIRVFLVVVIFMNDWLRVVWREEEIKVRWVMGR